MEVLVSGSSGLVGRALASSLSKDGCEVGALVRRDPRDASEVAWDPAGGTIDESSVGSFDAVVHLAGESVATGRWTARKRDRILESRVRGTRLLAETLARAADPPRVLVCASATGYYGDRGDEILDEAAAPGTGFLAEVCEEWERAAAPARDAGVRVVHLRIGVVLSTAGGALARMLPLFRLGLGGRLGSGRQWVSWITLDDLVRVIRHALSTESLEGPANAVAPRPVTNRELTRTLGRVLSRPAILPAPAFALRLALGRMADELLLASARVEPHALLESDFEHDHPKLEDALRHVLE